MRVAPGPPARIDALDGLRGLAVLLVLLGHSQVPFLGGGGATAGAAGVTVFFVLSGFLITGLLLAERDRRGTVSLRAFWARRALRLLPALVVFLAGTGVLVVATGNVTWGADLRNSLPVLLYVADFASLHHPIAYLDHTWSLAVEEQFYLVWPLVLLLGARLVRARALWLPLLALTAAGLWWRLRMGAAPGAAWETSRRFDTNLWPLALGGLLAVVCRLRTRPAVVVAGRVTLPVAAVGLVGLPELVRLAGYPTWVDTVHGQGLSAATAALLVLAAVDRSRARDRARPDWMSAPVLRWFGRRSYAIYLWHYPVLWADPFGVIDRLGRPWGLLVLCAVALVPAEASWWLVERPAMSLKARFARVPDGALLPGRRQPTRPVPARSMWVPGDPPLPTLQPRRRGRLVTGGPGAGQYR